MQNPIQWIAGCGLIELLHPVGLPQIVHPNPPMRHLGPMIEPQLDREALKLQKTPSSLSF